MTYAYRDPARQRRHPVREQCRTPEPPPPSYPSVLPEIEPSPTPAREVWGGRLGLELATLEIEDFNARQRDIDIGRDRLKAAADEIREYNRARGWKPPPRSTTR